MKQNQQRRMLEIAIQQLPLCHRRSVRSLFFAMRSHRLSVRSYKYTLERTLAVFNKAIAAIELLEG